MGRLTAGEYGPDMADDVTHYDAVEAYCDQLSYLPGEGVGLRCGVLELECELDSAHLI